MVVEAVRVCHAACPRVSSLSWSADGTKLAGSSLDCNRLMVWDVALGVGAKLRLGMVPVHLLSWSPDGNYLFAGEDMLCLGRIGPMACPRDYCPKLCWQGGNLYLQ